MTRRKFDDIRRKLLGERDCVEESLRRNAYHVFYEIDDTTRDAGDLASASHDRSVLYRLQEADMKRLTLINEVLSRIDEDGYGICEQCGEAIGRVRLEALPWAMNCLGCQEQKDSMESFATDSSVIKPVLDSEYDAA